MRHVTSSIASCLVLALLGASPLTVSADDGERPLASLASLHRACERARSPGRRALYVIDVVPGQFALGRYERESGFLAVDTHRNLRVLDGRAELFTSGLESIGFIASTERAGELRAAVGAGARLRVGFFLAFDGEGGNACLLRPAAAVTTVRADIGFVELVAADGSVIAREDSDRLRAWRDDVALDGVPGEGPRGRLLPATADRGAVPEDWQRAIAALNAGDLPAELGRCMGDATRGGTLAIRLILDPRTGRAVRGSVVLSTDELETAGECAVRAVSTRLQLPPTPGPLSLTVPIRLAR